MGQFGRLLDGVSDLGVYSAALAIARTFQAVGCDHLKPIGKPPHRFPSVDDVHEASKDPQCKNVVARFLKRF